MGDPISIDHFVSKMEGLNDQMRRGQLKHGEYDQRLARIISELRDRKLDADRAEIKTAIDGLLGRGVITPAVKDHLISRLGLG